MDSLNILFAGTSPILAYYAWKLSTVANVSLLIHDNSLAAQISTNGMVWVSRGQKHVFRPSKVFSSLSELSSSNFDAIFISSTSLQQLTTLCSQLNPLVGPNTAFIVESTGYLQLESYVVSNLQSPQHPSPIVFSIMCESDIKHVPNSPIFLHQQKSTHDYIYLGTARNTNDAPHSETSRVLFARLSSSFERADALLFKPSTTSEFLNYQWKLALPRIIFNPLLVLFELPYPVEISKEILAKPLISGLLNELSDLISKMGCKSFKGFESENALLNTWSKLYSDNCGSDDTQVLEKALTDLSINSKPEYVGSPNFFFEFYHQQQLDHDTLLLQPILLADDFSIKTPYLEFLYTTICQFAKLNNSTLVTTSSLFFIRNTQEISRKLKNLDNTNNLETRIVSLVNKNRSLEDSNASLIKQINELSLQLNSQRREMAKMSQYSNNNNNNNSANPYLNANPSSNALNGSSGTSTSSGSRSSGNSRPMSSASRRQSLVNGSNGQLTVNSVQASPQRSPARNSVHQLNFDLGPGKNNSVQQNPRNENSNEGMDDGYAELVDLSFTAMKFTGEARTRTPSPNSRMLNGNPNGNSPGGMGNGPGNPVSAINGTNNVKGQANGNVARSNSFTNSGRKPVAAIPNGNPTGPMVNVKNSRASVRRSASHQSNLYPNQQQQQQHRPTVRLIGNGNGTVSSNSVPQQQPQQPVNSVAMIPLSAQASFVDKPFGNSSSYLPIQDVSARFTPQSRKNRKSGMPMLGSRVASGASLATMGNPSMAHNVPPATPTSGNGKRDIDEYSLYGGASLPNGAVQRPPRNRASSYKNLATMSANSNIPNNNNRPVNNNIGNGAAYHSNRIQMQPPNQMSSANNSAQTTPGHSPSLMNSTQTPPTQGSHNTISSAPELNGAPIMAQSQGSNDSKNSIHSDGIFSNINSGSIDTQNSSAVPQQSKDLPQQPQQAVASVTASQLESLGRSNTNSSIKKKSKMKSFFGKKK
ncbi:Svl3 protein [Saccharomycopsis crataegensis]|uniref:Svl3 protein n=1 Tax=Saccharomycopsis crataegensis TaxID=43959 RepID=A0AAV5QH39_9ASCO|nr:Svl3 protein [Saccharomycopsis crataegensis]